MRIEQITFTRFIAAIAIVFFHFGKPLNIFSNEFVHTLLIQANIGVSYFFILSGFVMMIAYGRKSEVHPVSYMKNRFARIYPVYLLAIGLSLIYKTFLIKEHYTFSEIFSNILAVQAWFPSMAMSVNFPGWSLSVEFFFYAAFPFLFNYIYRRFSWKKITIPVLIFWAISQLIFIWAIDAEWKIIAEERLNKNFLFYFPLMHLNQFLLGNLTGLYYIKHLNGKAKNYDAAIIFIAFLIIASLYLRPSFISYHNGLMGILFVPFILLLALNNGWISRIFNHKFLVYLGEISYGIYILQVPIYMGTKYFLNKMGIHGSLVIFVTGVSVLLLASALSYHFVETPLREKIKKTRISFK